MDIRHSTNTVKLIKFLDVFIIWTFKDLGNATMHAKIYLNV